MWVAASAAVLRYGAPWFTSSWADRVITLTSGCCLPWVASQPSGTSSAPHKLSPRARSTPRRRQASTAMAASRYPAAAADPQSRCRSLEVNRATAPANRAHAPKAAATQGRGMVVSDRHPGPRPGFRLPDALRLTVSTDMLALPRYKS